MQARSVLVLLLIFAVLVAGVQSQHSAAAESAGPPIGGSCPVTHGGSVSNPCFAPSGVAQEERMVNGHPFNPSDIVAAETGLQLGGVEVDGCTPESRHGPCNYAYPTSISYYYGRGYLGMPQQTVPPFVWIGEDFSNHNLPGEGLLLKVSRDVSEYFVGMLGQPLTPEVNEGAWFLSATVPDIETGIGMITDVEESTAEKMAVALIDAMRNAQAARPTPTLTIVPPTASCADSGQAPGILRFARVYPVSTHVPVPLRRTVRGARSVQSVYAAICSLPWVGAKLSDCGAETSGYALKFYAAKLLVLSASVEGGGCRFLYVGRKLFRPPAFQTTDQFWSALATALGVQLRQLQG